jgi:hypothetical protein
MNGIGMLLSPLLSLMVSLAPVATNADLNVFKSFLSTLRFGDALAGSRVPPADALSAQEQPHKVPPGMLEGVYVGYNISAGRAGLRRLHFNSDGWVVKDVPEEGMIGFDFTAYRKARSTNRSWVGRYRVDGDKINIVWQDYTDDREQLTLEQDSAKPGIDTYVPMCLCTGKKFSGKYNYGLKGAGQYLQFSADGTFVDHKVLDQMLAPSTFYDHPRIRHGTYSIRSQTIIFKFGDGQRGTRTFIAPKAQAKGPRFDFIGLGWQTLYEEHHRDEP